MHRDALMRLMHLGLGDAWCIKPGRLSGAYKVETSQLFEPNTSFARKISYSLVQDHVPNLGFLSVTITLVQAQSNPGTFISRGLIVRPPTTQDKKLRHTVLDTTQSVLRDMTIHGYLRHPQGMLFKDITKDTIMDMIWIR